ncbi:MAG: hypothetical protein GY790_06615 [Bacteroidetes bacterium]|nr:hypothetical protein [Bacteroidota bacterium]
MKQFIIIMLFSGASLLNGQNQLDENGKKRGPWRVEYPNGKTLYEGTFIDGRPVGLLTRYYNTGAVRAKMMFDPQADRSHAELFYKGGKKAAEGAYAGKDKDSVWIYYSDYDGTVRIRESYTEGKINGKSIRYYPNGQVSEEVSWVMDSKDGPWLQYFEGGEPRLKGSYRDNMLNGLYEVWFSEGGLLMSGEYVDDKSEGTWSYYDDKAKLLYTLEYKDGQAVDQEKYMKLMQDTLLKYDTIETPQPAQFF